MTAKKTVAEAAEMEHLILEVRGRRVMLDEDAAELDAVSTGALNRAVGRNQRRFPSDLAFRFTELEHAAVLSQYVIPKLPRRGGRTGPSWQVKTFRRSPSRWFRQRFGRESTTAWSSPLVVVPSSATSVP